LVFEDVKPKEFVCFPFLSIFLVREETDLCFRRRFGSCPRDLRENFIIILVVEHFALVKINAREARELFGFS